MANYSLIILLGLIILNSCAKTDCTTALPPPNYFLLQVQDAAGNNLIGTTYTDSSYELTGENYQTFVSPEPTGAQYRLRVFPMDLVSGADYYLKLSDADTDTLRVFYEVNKGKCFTTFTLSTVFYNGTNFGNDRLMVVEKK